MVKLVIDFSQNYPHQRYCGKSFPCACALNDKLAHPTTGTHMSTLATIN